MTSSSRKKIANERAKILWDFYNEHGKIMCADVQTLLGLSVTNLYHSFFLHQVTGPPVFDTKAAIRERQISSLKAKAHELGKDWLTISEAAEATGLPEKEIYPMRGRYKGLVPEIRNKVRKRKDNEYNRYTDLPRQEIDSGEGLQYYQKRPGPEPGQVTYSLK